MEIDFIRLLKLSGILMEAITPLQAAAIFRQFGATEEQLSDPRKLSKLWKSLLKVHHSDKGGDEEIAKTINAAYDVLKVTAYPKSPVAAAGVKPGSKIRTVEIEIYTDDLKKTRRTVSKYPQTYVTIENQAVHVVVPYGTDGAAAFMDFLYSHHFEFEVISLGY